MPPDPSPSYLTPPEPGRLWRVTPEKVIALIRAGRLRAADLAMPGSRWPRFRISPQAVQDFELGRQPAPPPAPAVSRRRRSEGTLTRFI